MDPFFSPEVIAWFEWVLVWIGFGTCVGLMAKALMPGRDPGGAIATLLMGITGVVIGCGVYSLVYGERISPITSVGLACGTSGAFVILAFYRMLGGYLPGPPSSNSARPPFHEHPAPVRRRVNRRRRRRYSHDLDDY